MEKKREIYFDYLRIVSIFCVIGIHIVAKSWYNTPTKELSWQILNIYDSLFRFCVPIFIMISGALFLNKDKKIEIKTLFKKNILRIFIALVFWSFIYAVFKNLITYKGINKFVLDKILNAFLMGHHHLWFLSTILGIYLAMPLLKKICEDRKLEKYLIILSFIHTSLIPFLMNLKIFDLIFNDTIFMLEIPLATGYVGYYLLGHYLNTYNISNKKEKYIYVLGMCSLVFTILITSLSSVKVLRPIDTYYEYLYANTYVLSVSIFILFKYRISKIKISEKLKNKVVKLSNLVFGIYLVHEIFIIILDHYHFFKRNIMYSLLTPIFTVIIFIVSLLIVIIIKKIPMINKYII